jgi:hypothetical protein
MPDTLLDAMATHGLAGDSWSAWRVVAKLLDGAGDTMTIAERAVFEACTHRTRVPTERPAEMHLVVGRRGGKSRFGAVAAIRAMSRRYPQLAPGEQAICALAASDRQQARVLYGYASAPFVSPTRAALKALADLVTRRTRWELNLATGTALEIHTSHFGRVRGRTFAIALGDEIAFWKSESGENPASEVMNAIRPGLVTLNGQFLGLSTPHGKSDALWDLYSRYFGVDDDRVMIWQAASRVMNPQIPEAIVLDALERDEASARAEWLGIFRDDVSGLLTREALAAVVVRGRVEDLPKHAEVDYLPFVDAASGSGGDSMTMAVSHVEQEQDGRLIAVIDTVREAKPPFNPETVVQEFAALARRYGAVKVWGDRYARGFVDSAFARAGLEYVPSKLTRSELYVALLALVNARSVELPEHAKLVNQLVGLQRRLGAGRESVDHPSHGGAHDDLANSVAGCAVLVHRFASSEAARPPARIW